MKKILPHLIFIALISMLYSCKTAKPLSAQAVYGGSEMLFQYKWNFTEINGQPVSTGRDTAQLLFYPGQVSRVSGSTGCNRLNGTFELSGVNKIKFSPLVITRMACPGQDESQLLTALGEVNNWSIIDDQLLLNNGRILLAKLRSVPVLQ